MQQLEKNESAAERPPKSTGPIQQCLIIDDSATVRQFLRQCLKERFSGVQIHEAQDGKDALKQLRHCKVDLIVTDLQMPGMDGQTFLRLLGGNPILKKKPVLVLSSEVNEELKAKFDGVMPIRFLRKPVSKAEIIGEVSSLLLRANQAAAQH